MRTFATAHGLLSTCLLIVAPTLAAAQFGATTPIMPGGGLSFTQVDLTYPGAVQTDSQYGLASVDAVALLTGFAPPVGYVNVSSPDGWLVRNLPVGQDMIAAGYPGLSVFFDLGAAAGDVTALTVSASISSYPQMIAPTGVSPQTFAVGSVEHNAQGMGSATRQASTDHRIDLSSLSFDPVMATTRTWQPGHPNVEAGTNQCGPAAVANSLQYLENTFGVEVVHDNAYGVGPASGKLAGTLDGYMNRSPGGLVSPDNWREGKTQYLADHGPAGLVCKSYGFGGDISKGGSAGTVRMDDQTGDGGLGMLDWIQREVDEEEDVEIVLDWENGPAHAVEITGAGMIMGVPYITWAHDFTQGSDATGTAPNGVGTGPEDGGLGFSFVDPATGATKNFVGVGGGLEPQADAKITYAMSQSVPEPTTILALVFGGALLWRRRGS